MTREIGVGIRQSNTALPGQIVFTVTEILYMKCSFLAASENVSPTKPQKSQQ